jgi:hypothetical protein
MDIGNPDEKDLKDKKPKKYRVVEGFLQEEQDSLIFFENGMEPAGRIKFSEIKSIEIKPAGTLYDGSVKINLLPKGELNYTIKNYQQEDFAELKARLGK